ncbi:MAG: hypothetical protein GY869_26110 [Planctomycetes bacterium]|nr:hypothetical protein [Planctomycetota bacterium]
MKRIITECNYHIIEKMDAFVGYEWRQWEDDRFAESKSSTQRFLLGIRYNFLPFLYGRLQLRRAWTELIGDNPHEPMIQQKIGLEVGTDIKRHFRGAVGYEFLTYDDKEQPGDDYDANRIYGKLMAKF